MLYAIVDTYWLFFGGGIAYLEKYPGVIGASVPLDSRSFKIQWLLQIVVGVIAFLVLYFVIDIPFDDLPIIVLD